jgi:hypothetical protein
MAQAKAWTKKKRARAARKGAATRRTRAQIIELAQQSHETSYALLIPFGAWIKDSIKLKERIETTVSLKKGPKSQFSVPDVITGLVVAAQAGVVHGSHLDKLVPEVKLAESIGLPHFFGATTASDLLKQAQPRHVKETQRVVRAIGWPSLADEDDQPIEVAVDTTGHPSDARQREGVKVGYCNGKREPCLKSGRVVVNGLPVFVDAYPGNENPHQPFEVGLAVARLLCRRYPRRPVHLSADSASASESHLNQLHRLAKRSPNFRYSLCISLLDPHQRPTETVQLARTKPKKQWKRINATTSVLDVGWRKVYWCSQQRTRQIVVRRLEEKTRRGRRGRVKIETVPRFYLIATNYSRGERKARQVFRGYHRRTMVESSIKDGKQSFDQVPLPHQKFQANRLSLLVLTLAQLLGRLYQRRLLPAADPAATGPLIATLRSDLWSVPGRFTDPTHIILAPVYRRCRWIKKVCRAVQRHFGFSIIMAGFDSS